MNMHSLWVGWLLAGSGISILAGEAAPSAGASASSTARLVIRAGAGQEKISRHIYGHFAEHLGRCIYEGIWVGEESPIPNTRGIRNDVVAALKEIGIPVLRWPGGCFADEYHWKDGIGPRAGRPSMINTHWGGVVENNHFGTHEFLDLCSQLGCEPYICGNVGSGTVREMQEWVEYITFDGQSPMANLRRENGRDQPWKLTYFGVGNENWGCGGHMTPEYYADQYRRYATYVRNFGENRISKIACGPSGGDYRWTEVLMQQAGRQMWGLALHYYCGSGRNSRSATRFDEADWFHQLRSALRIEELIVKHAEVMDRFDPQKRVALIVDEWGAWHAVEPGTNPGFLYQQNTLRDALVAGVTLNIFNRHCDRVKMANIAQTINVLQAMILTRGAEMIRTPTHHVFAMFRPHHDATLVPIELEAGEYRLGAEAIPAVSASASRDAQGRVHITLCHLNPNSPVTVSARLEGARVSRVRGQVLTGPSIASHNTFEQPDVVRPAAFDGARLAGDSLEVVLPPKSVVALELE